MNKFTQLRHLVTMTWHKTFHIGQLAITVILRGPDGDRYRHVSLYYAYSDLSHATPPHVCILIQNAVTYCNSLCNVFCSPTDLIRRPTKRSLETYKYPIATKEGESHAAGTTCSVYIHIFCRTRNCEDDVG